MMITFPWCCSAVLLFLLPSLCVCVCVRAAPASILTKAFWSQLRVISYLFCCKHLCSSRHLQPLFSPSGISHDLAFRLKDRRSGAEGRIDPMMLSACMCVCVLMQRSTRGRQPSALVSSLDIKRQCSLLAHEHLCCHLKELEWDQIRSCCAKQSKVSLKQNY